MDEAIGQKLTAAQVVSLMSRTLEWRCRRKDCSYALRFPLHQIDAIPFFIVRHMLEDHGVKPEEVVDTEPALAKEVEEYCRELGVRG